MQKKKPRMYDGGKSVLHVKNSSGGFYKVKKNGRLGKNCMEFTSDIKVLVENYQEETCLIDSYYRWFYHAYDKIEDNSRFANVRERVENIYANTDRDYIDKRTIRARPEPANKLTKEEKQEILETLYALGITPSKSRPRVSNDNPYAESLFKTLNYVPNFQPQGFATLTEARLWVKRFVEWYHNEHRHIGINYVTPSQRHMGLDQEVLRKRKAVYEKAKERHPERWAKETRAWSFSEEEWLNPRQETETKKEAKVS